MQTDTSVVDKELANYENKLTEVDLNKARLENEMTIFLSMPDFVKEKSMI